MTKGNQRKNGNKESQAVRKGKKEQFCVSKSLLSSMFQFIVG